MGKRGFIFDLMDEFENNAHIHQSLVEEIEDLTKRNVILYHANFNHPVGLMLDHDAEIFEDILSTLGTEKYENKLDLVVHSPGGLPEVAAKFIKVARSYCPSLRVVVPSTAMSAATLLAMGADSIVMSDTSKLGPIDPQMQTVDRLGRPIFRPAKAFVDAFNRLIRAATEAIKRGDPPQAFFALLNNEDPSWVNVCNRARQATERLAFKLLKANMLSDKSDAVVSEVVKKFVEVGEESSHGSPLFWEEAKDFGLKIDYENKTSDVWKKRRELQVRVDRYISGKGSAKYFVCRKGGIDMSVQLINR